jgi:hypothetical protein
MTWHASAFGPGASSSNVRERFRERRLIAEERRQVLSAPASIRAALRRRAGHQLGRSHQLVAARRASSQQVHERGNREVVGRGAGVHQRGSATEKTYGTVSVRESAASCGELTCHHFNSRLTPVDCSLPAEDGVEAARDPSHVRAGREQPQRAPTHRIAGIARILDGAQIDDRAVPHRHGIPAARHEPLEVRILRIAPRGRTGRGAPERVVSSGGVRAAVLARRRDGSGTGGEGGRGPETKSRRSTRARTIWSSPTPSYGPEPVLSVERETGFTSDMTPSAGAKTGPRHVASKPKRRLGASRRHGDAEDRSSAPRRARVQPEIVARLVPQDQAPPQTVVRLDFAEQARPARRRGLRRERWISRHSATTGAWRSRCPCRC